MIYIFLSVVNNYVSLPGSDVSSIEQPAILQVLSPLNATEEKIDKIKESPANRVILLKQPSSEEPQSHNDVNDNDNSSDINLVSSSNNTQSQSHLVITTPTPTPTPSPTKDCKFDPQTGEILFPETHINPSQDNILDIESHLIETYNELFPNEESVGINELPPIEDELQVGCSKIETNDNVRTVIEVQPAEVVSKKPIEKVIETNEPLQVAHIIVPTDLSNGESGINEEEIEKVAKKLIQDIEEEITNNWDKITSQVNFAKDKNEDESEAEEEEETTPSENVTDDVNSATVDEKKENSKELLEEKSSSVEVNTVKENIILTENLEENKSQSTIEDLPISNANSVKVNGSTTEENLSEVVDQQLSEVNSILDSQTKLEEPAKSSDVLNSEKLQLPADKHPSLKVVTVPLSKTASEEEERKLFIESLPPLEAHETTLGDAEQLALDCKREYYQSLKKYLVQSSTDKPPVPLQTYRWEDLRRAKERGGYPWTHLYKRPLGPDEQPEIVLMLRKSQEIRFTSESPKSNKKVRIDDHVSIQETERYIQELSEEEDEPNSEHLPNRQTEDLENHSLHSESLSFASDSVLTTGKQPKKSGRFSKVRRLFRRRRYGARHHDDAQSLPDSFTNTSLQLSLEQVPQDSNSQLEQQKQVEELKGDIKKEDEPIYVHSKSPRCFPIMKKLKSMADRQKKRLNIKRIHLGKNEQIVLNEEPKILKLKNSPKSQRSDIPHFIEKQDSDDVLEIVQLDESPSRKRRDDDRYDNEETTTSSIVKPEEIIEISDIKAAQTEVNQQVDEEVTYKKAEEVDAAAIPPKKAPRLRREHVYEEIDQPDEAVAAAEELKFILDATSVDAIKQSLATQDTCAIKEVSTTNNNIPLDRMGSSEEEPITLTDRATPERKSNTLLAPISSIDSASSDEDRSKVHLQPVTEEETDQELDDTSAQQANLTVNQESDLKNERKPSLKKEASPAPSEKKVTFSHVEDEAEPHREDIELTAEQLEATKEATKWKNTINEHEYEPIGTPSTEEKSSDIKEVSPNEIQTTTNEVDTMKQAEDIQKDLEDRYFSSVQTQSQTTQKTPQMEIDVEAMETEDVAIEDDQLPKAEKKGFMASAQDKTRRMQAGFKNQAGKLKTKLKPAPKKIPSGSPKAKDRKKFKAPEFSKLKMPEMKRPDMSKFKDFKRPEFTKFSKPDMSKFKLPEKMTNIKLRRSKSLKESDAVHVDEELDAEVTETGQKSTEAPATHKKLFEFNFGTYPRALRKKKTVEVESSFGTGTATEATSVIPSTETQPSLESSSTPQGDRGPGPVRSRWADKFSDVSYNDSEGSRYRRYGSEQESFDRESSLERRMREDLEDAVSEERNLGILGGVTDNKQFAEFDEENRAIHEISNLRSGEFRRRPMTHQDSDVRSEDSKEAVGWTEKDIQKNTLLRKAEREAEASYLKYQSDDMGTQETQSTASSGKKVVLEEIGDDEFFLRKRGISQDNIEINQYIRNAFRDDYDKPINSLEHVGQTSAYGDYDVPPPKPRRLHKTFAPDNVSQDFDGQRSDYGDDLSMSHNGSDYFGAPRRPMRKGRSRSKYSMESQDVDSRKYMDEEYLRDPSPMLRDEHGAWNDLNMSEKENIPQQHDQPLPPRRQKRRRDTSMDKDSYINGFGGRSVSNSFLQPTEDVIVYRTEHEYHHVPLATPEKYSDNGSTRKSVSNYDLDERHSRGAISFEQNEDVQETEKFVIDMMENDGYAVVRKEAVPKPTPPARRKKFARSPGERFATMPNMRTKRSTPPPERPPPPRGYTPVSDVGIVSGRKSALSLDAQPNYEDDYEEPGVIERNLQSGEVINKMKYRPLPPPPRPPREKRQRSASKGSEALQDYRSYDSGDVVDGNFDKTDESDIHVEEVEACTQTDPLPDDFVCEEFEITDDMKVIEPRVRLTKTVEELLQEELEKELNVNHQVIDSEQLAKGLQRFRDANQRSLSERSRASSQADRSKSLSRPQTPSAILVERQSSTPIQKDNTEVVEASLVVRPIDDLELEEEELRREGLLTDSSQHSVSDTKEDYRNLAVSEASYAPSSTELDEALGVLTSDPETQQTDEEVERTLQRYRDELDAIGRELMETQTTSQEPSPSVSREEIKVSDREIEPSDREEEPRSDLDELLSDGEFRDESILSEIKEEEELTISEVEIPEVEPPQPPPRRKSTTAIEQSPPHPALEEPQVEVKQISSTESSVKKQEVFPTPEESTSLPIPSPKVEQPVESSKDLAPMQTIVKAELPTEQQLPARLGDLEVERLRVHALQAGQIMVSQLHGQQISSDELECKSGNLVVQNIELPPGLIENIVEQVRQKERSQHLTTETQTSPQHSSEHLSSSPARDIVPPPKPPRLRDQVPQPTATVPNADEQTQTDQTTPLDTATVTALPSAVFPTAEYLQSLAPLAFYNLHRAAAAAAEDTNLDVRPPQRNRRHHRRSSSSEVEDKQFSEDEEKVHHRRRTRSTRTPSSDDSQSVTKAGSKFITACSLSLCKIINQLTDFIRGKEPKEGVEVEPTDIRNRQVPALVVLFIVITFFVLLYLMTGRSVHTHHWDYFNPPGQEGR
ncbi:uncharacterized protein LOC111683316 isoform X2 [Lucilia cuprina]|uniref:uncharacterized protein LOC111683316 isoform X2 n=1 Tax=Lucilia cuprina TaxID=7375 RepID=UPI001F05109C|nr:uncharacterized protein LOC111683316 isoform X2 [Lucilia cuprina]